jgi:hypothetical protein
MSRADNAPVSLTLPPVRLAKRLRVQFSYRDGATRVEWDPCRPAVLPRAMRRRYRVARTEFCRELAALIYGPVLVAELAAGDGIEEASTVHPDGSVTPLLDATGREGAEHGEA